MRSREMEFMIERILLFSRRTEPTGETTYCARLGATNHPLER